MIIIDTFNANMILSNKTPPTRTKQVKNASPKKRGRPAGVKNKCNKSASPSLPASAAEKQPGDVSFPLTCWSLTITRSGGDIHTSLLDNMNQFLHDVCTRGFAVLVS